MRRPLDVGGYVLLIVGLVLGIYPYVSGQLSPTSMPPQPVAASQYVGLDLRPAPTRYKAPAIQPAVRPAPAATPVWLSIPYIGVDESIASVGLIQAGELEPPPAQTIWYNRSVRPGRPGISLIAGHVQWGASPDNFWRLIELPDGAPFSIRYSNGAVAHFVVVRHKSELKTDVQRDQAVWGSSATPVVVLITCDKTSPLVNHHYLDNLMVFARLK